MSSIKEIFDGVFELTPIEINEKAAPDLYIALKRAYSDILNIINEGEFKEGIEWNSGYIEDALKKARGDS